MRNTTLLTLGRGSLAIAASVAAFGIQSATAGEGGSHRASAPAAEACASYIVQPGDTLGAIAVAATGDRAKSDLIFRMNRDVLSSPDHLVVGTVLDMPCAGAYRADMGTASERVVAPEPEMVGWVAEPGEFLVPVLTEWGQRAGYDVIVENNSDWRFGVGYASRGNFRAAVDEVIAGFASSAVPPVVVFYNNNVMTIGAR